MSDHRLFHIALASEWDEAQRIGSYDRSTIGASVGEVGFIHCSRGIEQVRTVLGAHYAQVNAPLVLLDIDEGSLSSAALHVVDEQVDPDDLDSEAFPHIYGGALPIGIVTEVVPLEA